MVARGACHRERHELSRAPVPGECSHHPGPFGGGYAEVAPHFDPGQPAVRLSLVEIAREAGTGYELLFFQCLGGKLRKLLGSGTTSFEFTGLTPCVKHLRARKSWNRECDSLRSEIVEFVRTQTSVIPARGEITVNVC